MVAVVGRQKSSCAVDGGGNNSPFPFGMGSASTGGMFDYWWGNHPRAMSLLSWLLCPALLRTRP